MSWFRDGDLWLQVVKDLRNPDISDEEIAERLKAHDDRLGSKVTLIDTDNYVPVLRQDNSTVASSVLHLQGIRLGPWVQLNVTVLASAAGTANGIVDLSLPPTLLMVNSNRLGCGDFHILDESTQIEYNGTAFSTGTSPTRIRGAANGAANYLGAASFTAALAAGDVVGFSVQYLVTREAV